MFKIVNNNILLYKNNDIVNRIFLFSVSLFKYAFTDYKRNIQEIWIQIKQREENSYRQSEVCNTTIILETI